jgi:hypothetical protein
VTLERAPQIDMLKDTNPDPPTRTINRMRNAFKEKWVLVQTHLNN